MGRVREEKRREEKKKEKVSESAELSRGSTCKWFRLVSFFQERKKRRA